MKGKALLIGKNRHDVLRVMFAGGGTGGHMMPGAAVAGELVRLHPGTRCLFLTGARRAEKHCHAALRRFETAPVADTPWAGIGRKVLFPARALASAARTLDLVRAFRPHVIVGLGSYNCVCPVLTGRLLGVRIALLEANAIPGKAVRLLAPTADRVFVQWPVAARWLRCARVRAAGNPVRRALLCADRRQAAARLGLEPDKVTLLAMGGSQGARFVNRMLYEALRILTRAGTDLQVLHLTGSDNLPEARRWQANCDLVYRPFGFLRRMEDAWAAADFVLNRAGASSLAEMTALGLPSVLVPLPDEADGHQSANAAVLQKAGAALVVRQNELSAGRLAIALNRLATDAALRARMGRRACALGRPDAARTVAAELAAICGFLPRSQERGQPAVPTSLSRAA